jgi:hypothetical protein
MPTQAQRGGGSSNPFATRLWKEMGSQHHPVAALPWERPGPHCTGG